MTIKFEVSRADLTFEAAYSEPDFGLFRDPQGLLHHLYKALEPHGIRLADMRIQREAQSAADSHLLCYLFDLMMTLRVYLDRVNVYCSPLRQDYVERFGTAIVHALGAVRAHHPDLSFRAHALAVGLHGSLQGDSVKRYLSRFAAHVPEGLGPAIGSGTVMYFGPEGERLLCSVTVDLSPIVADALFVRTHVVWDAKKVEIAAIPNLGEGFIRQALHQIDLELP